MGRRRIPILISVAVAGALIALRIPERRVAWFPPEGAERPVADATTQMDRTEDPSAGDRVPALEVAPVSSPGTGTTAIPVRHSISGFILSLHGTPVPGSLVAFYSFRESDPRSETQALSDANGQFAIEVGGSDGYLVARDTQLSTVFLGDTRTPDPGIPPVVVVSPARPIAGEVVGEDGLALEGVEVSIDLDVDRRVFESRLERSVRRSWSTWTRKDGRFSIPDAPAVEGAKLRFWHRRHVAVELPLVSQQDWIRIELRRLPRGPTHIEGVVLDPSGAPVRGVHVSAEGRSRSSMDDGTFELDLPDSGASDRVQEVLAFAPGWLPAHATVREGEVVITLSERIPPIRGRVVDADGTPVPSAIVELLDPPTAAEISRFVGLAPPDEEKAARAAVAGFRTETDDRGRFEIAGVLPRGFTVRAHDSRTLSSGDVQGVRTGSEIELRIAERPRLELSGRVVDPRGQPIEGASVRLVRELDGRGEFESEEQWTDEEGRFAWRTVDGGHLSIAVQVQSYAAPRRYPLGTAEHGERTLIAGRAACVRVQIATAGLQADAFRILDAEGEVLWLGDGDGSREALRRNASDELGLDEGESMPFWVSEDASMLVLHRDGIEVLQLPIRLLPGGITVLRP
jgi:protocatechuate 3,4-dioxygenase beta subunit